MNVKSGLFNSASEVIRQALRLLLKQEAEEEARLQALRSAVLAGLQSGGPEQWDIKKFRNEAKARIKFLEG